MNEPLIVFSHLPWDFVYQRPQHLLSRLARQRRVIYFEEPRHEAGTEPRLTQHTPCDNVLVVQPVTDVQMHGFHDDQLKLLKPLLQQLLAEQQLDDYVAWFYTPMALPLLAELTPRAVVYDCMDELSAFKGAPRQMRQRESALLKAAHLVLTGGPSLYRAKRELHPNVVCLPSSVDAAHYAPGRITQNCEHYLAAEQLQGHILAPRIGFFGVIDERLDLALLAAAAQRRPDWHFVMVGPVVKIDRATLPQQDNIHWLGQQPYARLPSLVAGWDVCMLPFALNEHTRFISPTKTLEYLAAEKPVVSTPVTDVVDLYGDVVAIADGVDAFIAACEAALRETPAQRAERLQRSAQTVSRYAWDEAARTVEHGITEAVGRADAGAPAGPPLPLQPAADGHADALQLKKPAARPGEHPAPRRVRHLVIGAGPAGLAAAQLLSAGGAADLLLVEREARVGGSCGSVQEQGHTFDLGPVGLSARDPELKRLAETLLGDALQWRPSVGAVLSHGVQVRYPLHESLHALPPEVRKECLLGAIEARFGSLKYPAADALLAGPSKHLEEFVQRHWGRGLARHFALPWLEKRWGLPASQLDASWLEGRVPLPDLEPMVDGALQPRPRTDDAPLIGTPRSGGMQALMDAFVPHLAGELALSTQVVQVSPADRTVLLDDGRTIEYESLISTLPLPALVAACADQAPPEVQAAARALRQVSVRRVHLGIAREDVAPWQWMACPEADVVFHRVIVQPGAPAGSTALVAEVRYGPQQPLPCEGPALLDRVLTDLRRIGLLREGDDVRYHAQVDRPNAYPVPTLEREAQRRCILDWLAQHGILGAEAEDAWEDLTVDPALAAGRRAAEQALAAAQLREAAQARLGQPALALAGDGNAVLQAAAKVMAAGAARAARAAQMQ
jgi:UDP-galactopyranose mutase